MTTSELPLSSLAHHRAAFPGTHLALVIDAILAGTVAARLWEVRPPDGSSLLLLWDKGNNVLYLAGKSQDPSALAALREVIVSHIRPQSRAEGALYFKTQPLSESLTEQLPRLFEGIALRLYPTLFYEFPVASAPPSALLPIPGMTIVSITPELMAQEMENSEQVRGEIRWMWPSEAHFYAQGFGMVALMQAQIVCWCTAEYVGPARCGIGIATLPAFEGQGIATATAMHFVRAALERGLVPYWECGATNHGSRRVAEKVGFTRLAEEHYWVGSFGEQE